MRLYPEFERFYPEVLVDPHSGFWFYHQETDPHGDPLELLIGCEEGDEVAQDICRGRCPKGL